MPDGGKLVNINVDLSNLEGLSDSVKILMNRISSEIGQFTKPHHVRRIAKAKAEAAVIEAETQNKISDIQERGLRRMVIEEGKRQGNIESIVARAIPHVQIDGKTDQIEKDWITNFFDKCKLVSDDDMQEMWARLLAQEGNSPNTISKRTIALMATLDKNDAELFTKFCSCIWVIGTLTALVFDEKSGPSFDEGMNFARLTHLDSIGLITFNALGGFQRQGFGKYTTIAYYGRALNIDFPQDTNSLAIGKVLLTDAGRQLAIVCGSNPSINHYDFIVEKFYGNGLTLSSHIENRGFI